MSTLAILVGGFTAPAGAAPAVAPKPKCSSGWIALTFDDGPDPVLTRRLVKILVKRDVPATFFMVGERVASAPDTARFVARQGFKIANHSYQHADMRTQRSAAVRKTLRHTARELTALGIKPSRLMRPPYGSIDRRVRRAIVSQGLVPVLWTVDSADWAGGNARAITKRVLSRLHPGGTNIVLQHDGVTNSPASVAAVPRIIKSARARGYCFTSLDRSGLPRVPTPTARISTTPAREGAHGAVTITLDHATTRGASVTVRTTPATAGTEDVTPRVVRVRFAPGQVTQTVALAAVPDEIDEESEEFGVELTNPDGLVLPQQLVSVAVIDSRRAPAVAVSPATVAEPTRRDWALARVRVWLGRTSGHDVTVTLSSRPGEATSADFAPRSRTVTIPAGESEAWVSFPVARDNIAEGAERFGVVIESATDAWVARKHAWVTITS
ncbi:MAG: polysaccharide deacetylase family protein [Nocardioides sp.]